MASSEIVPAPEKSPKPPSRAAPSETAYPVKWVVDEHGNSAPIALQGANGPCALLALLNVQFQRGTLKLPPGTEVVSETRAMSMLAELAMTATVDAKPEELATREQAVQHFVELLPSLRRGMHVNVRFYSPTAFEFTKEIAAFDCFPDIKLVHGWLVDPQDEDLVEAFGDLSYNQVMDEMVRLNTVGNSEARESSSLPLRPAVTTNAPNDDPYVTPPRIVPMYSLPRNGSVGDRATVNEQDLIDIELPPHLQPSAPPLSPNEDSFDGVATLVDAMDGLPDSVRTEAVTSAPAVLERTSSEECEDEVRDELDVPPSSGIMNMAAPIVVDETILALDEPVVESGREDEVTAAPTPPSPIAKHARKVWEFFEAFPTQLTYHGIAELNASLKDGDTCILFRNSHFYVLRKRHADLYTLATDVGFYREVDIAWELLRDVNGDSDFYSASFYPALPGQRAAGAMTPPPPTTAPVGRNATTSARPPSAQQPCRQQRRVNGTGRSTPAVPPGYRRKDRRDETCTMF